MKKTLIAFVVGALVGTGLVWYFGVGFIGWYGEPPMNIGVSCRAAVEWSLRRLLWLQAAGMFGGGFIGYAIARAFSKRKGGELPGSPLSGQKLSP